MTDEEILTLHMQRARSNYGHDEDVVALLNEIERLLKELKWREGCLQEILMRGGMVCMLARAGLIKGDRQQL